MSRLPTPGLRKSTLVDQHGRPMAYWQYPSPRWNLRQYKPRFWLAGDTKVNVSAYDRWEMVNYSRQLRSQIDVLDTAITQKNSWAFGDAWEPHYCGQNAKWGQEAEEFLRYQFYPMCNVRGPLYHFKRSLSISGMAWDTDGDDLMILTETENHFPQLAFYSCMRIGWGGQLSGVHRQADFVQEGPFDGAKIFDGIIMDRNGRMIGVRVVDEDGNVSDLSSFNADLAYEPVWSDQGRGIPRIAVSLLRWMNLQDIDEFLQRGMKRAAAIGLKFKTEEGEAGVGNEVITSEVDQDVPAGNDTTETGGNTPKVYYEEIEGGEAYFFNSTTGEDVEEFRFQNPHPNSEAFIERLTRGSLASVGWFYELLDLNQTGRAPSRLLCDLANQSIWSRQAAGELRARRAVVYALAKAMKHGFISRNDDGMDPYLWEFGLPKQVSVDAGNDEQADRENLKIGTTSKAILAQKRGLHWKQILRQRHEEIIANAVEAADIEKDTAGKITFEKAMELLEQRSANPQSRGGARENNAKT
ncbi:MAG TPA: phage portal protein [Verrucomicrobiae bacterium]|nr:phage portal protein [Verrucomicrobiae bacterium]